jgi:hypothetical protein
MRTALPILIALAVLTGCQSQPNAAHRQSQDGIYDFTAGRSAVCEIHGVTMSPKVVDLEFGMKAITETDTARRQLFPHADEPYDTGYCIPLVERRGRVYLCPRCTEARALWFRTHKPVKR